MGKLFIYAESKDKLAKDIVEETERLYKEGLSYNEALRKAKEMYIKEGKEDD